MQKELIGPEPPVQKYLEDLHNSISLSTSPDGREHKVKLGLNSGRILVDYYEGEYCTKDEAIERFKNTYRVSINTDARRTQKLHPFVRHLKPGQHTEVQIGSYVIKASRQPSERRSTKPVIFVRKINGNQNSKFEVFNFCKALLKSGCIHTAEPTKIAFMTIDLCKDEAVEVFLNSIRDNLRHGTGASSYDRIMNYDREEDASLVYSAPTEFLKSKGWESVGRQFLYKRVKQTYLIAAGQNLYVYGHLSKAVIGCMTSVRNCFDYVYVKRNQRIKSDFFVQEPTSSGTSMYSIMYDVKLKIGSRWNSEVLNSFLTLNSRDRLKVVNPTEDTDYVRVEGISMNLFPVYYSYKTQKFRLLYSTKFQNTKSAKKVSEFLQGISSEAAILAAITPAEFAISDCLAYNLETSASKSCMTGRGEGLQKFYPNTKEWLGLAVLTKNDGKELCARAHIWKFDEVVYVDRLYPNDPHHKYHVQMKSELRKKYGEDPKCLDFRDGNSAGHPNSIDTAYIVTWKGEKAPEYVPYMDTFDGIFVDEDDNLVFKCESSLVTAVCHSSPGAVRCQSESYKPDVLPKDLDVFKKYVKRGNFTGKIKLLSRIRITNHDPHNGYPFSWEPLSTANVGEDVDFVPDVTDQDGTIWNITREVYDLLRAVDLIEDRGI